MNYMVHMGREWGLMDRNEKREFLPEAPSPIP
jgi:hypothetical protein